MDILLGDVMYSILKLNVWQILGGTVYVLLCWPLLILVTVLENDYEKLDVDFIWFSILATFFMIVTQLIWIESLLKGLGLI